MNLSLSNTLAHEWHVSTWALTISVPISYFPHATTLCKHWVVQSHQVRTLDRTISFSRSSSLCSEDLEKAHAIFCENIHPHAKMESCISCDVWRVNQIFGANSMCSTQRKKSWKGMRKVIICNEESDNLHAYPTQYFKKVFPSQTSALHSVDDI